jgi:ferredoxin
LIFVLSPFRAFVIDPLGATPKEHPRSRRIIEDAAFARRRDVCYAIRRRRVGVMPVVYFVKQQRAVECPVGANLRDVARQNDIDVYVFPNNLANCRGNGLCGTCRVKVDNPRALSPRTRSDERKCGWEGDEYRLACQTKVLTNVSVVTAPRKVLAWTNHPTYQWMQNLE